MLSEMSTPVWSVEEAGVLLADVYAGSLGEASEIDPVTQEELVRAMDADPAYLEATWDVWHRALRGVYGWNEQRIGEARYWLDAELLGALLSPEPHRGSAAGTPLDQGVLLREVGVTTNVRFPCVS